jgi:N-acetylglucosamine malate deacetylase 1
MLFPESTLVVAPHADDEVLGAGGLIARLTRAGRKVHVLYAVIDGLKHYGNAEPTRIEERLSEIAAVAALLGFSYDILYEGQDLIERLDTLPQKELVDHFEAAFNKLRPELLALPHGVDFDQDHRACFQAAFAAARPIPAKFAKHLPPKVISYEMPKLTWSDEAFHPSLYVDIRSTIDVKLEGLRTYKSQLRGVPHLRSPENIAALAHLRGSEIGVSYAEAFRIYRWVL